MNDKIQEQEQQQEPALEEQEQYESYGWDFHKTPLLYALVLTALFYAFIFFFFNI